MRGAAKIFPLMALLLACTAASALELKIFGGKLSESASAVLSKAIEKREALIGNVNEQREAEMGKAAASVLLGAAPLVRDAELQRYVNSVGHWIALQSERPNLDWRFGVLEDDTANAFAAPSGYIFITKGLFRVLRNEAELAGVLGHEIAHVVAKHHVQAMVKQGRFEFLAESAQAVSGEDTWLADAAVAASKKIYSSGLDQSVEFDADRMGVVLAARAGYDAYGLTHALMTLEGVGTDEAFLGYFLSTHPSSAERLDNLNALLETEIQGDPGRAPSSDLARAQARLQ